LPSTRIALKMTAMIILASLSRRLIAAGSLSLLGLCSCAAQPADTAAQLAQQIESLIGDAACEGAAQCRTIAVGAKPCGGPERYMAWSTARTDEQQLKDAVAKHAAQRRADNQASRMSSNCMMVTNPGASCSARRCSLNKQGIGTQPTNPY
jgi:hypothetical protein